VCGVIFFNNVGYLGMCGHGTIGLVVTLAHLDRIKHGDYQIETPVGIVTATLHKSGEVSVTNVPSWRAKKDFTVNVPGIGNVTGDVAWGGNWFYLVEKHGQELTLRNADALSSVDLLPEILAHPNRIPLRLCERSANSRNFIFGFSKSLGEYLEPGAPPSQFRSEPAGETR
jgi:proline racemase